MPFFILQLPRVVASDNADGGTQPNPAIHEVKSLLGTRPPEVGIVSWFEQADHEAVLFAVSGDSEAEHMLGQLTSIGVGHEYGFVSMIDLDAQLPRQYALADESFFDSIKSRVIVERVVQQTKEQAVFSFDFLCLVIVASLLAAIGLATNSAVIVVASMLVSPIMGPILAVTFGSVVRDWQLVRVGVLSELLSLLLCVLDGFLVGLCFAPFGPSFGIPTAEMLNRGTSVGIVIGIAIALPSGIGVALSVLGNNTSSLVGVAISASLLPPAVNCGMCFAYAILGPRLHGADVVDAVALFNTGSISFLLTIVNIICVFIAAWAMYKVKEVAPLPGKTHFWSTDLPAARHFKTMNRADADELQQQLRRRMDMHEFGNGPASLDAASSVTWHPPSKDLPRSRRVRMMSAGEIGLGTGMGTLPPRLNASGDGTAPDSLRNLFVPPSSAGSGIEKPRRIKRRKQQQQQQQQQANNNN
jgi:uncharacterized hydrophobic protein (TIGR00271 family)